MVWDSMSHPVDGGLTGVLLLVQREDEAAEGRRIIVIADNQLIEMHNDNASRCRILKIYTPTWIPLLIVGTSLVTRPTANTTVVI